MKRTPLVRKTPLKPGSALRRTAMKPWRRAEADKMPSEVARAVFARDRGCVAPRLDPDAGHCQNKWGDYVLPNDVRARTLEHVHEDYGKTGKRADNDIDHLVWLCEGHGVQSWELAHKDLLRLYIAIANSKEGWDARRWAEARAAAE